MRLLATLLLLVSTSTVAADIAFLLGAPNRFPLPNDGRIRVIPEHWLPRIMLVGPIAPGDDKRFAEVLKQAQEQGRAHEQGKWWTSNSKLLLDSEGGDVAVAMSIGRMVRRAQLTTAVHDNRVCASACILILAGGVWRYARDDARLGLHRPYFSDARGATAKGYETFRQAYDSVIDAHRAYFSEMRIGSGLLERMIQIPSNQVQWISVEQANNLNLLGEDATYHEWLRARSIARDGAECVDWTDNRFLPCVSKLGWEAEASWKRCRALTNQPPQCK